MCTRPALRAPPLRLPALRALPPLMLMMRPQPAFFMKGMTAREQRSAPTYFTLKSSIKSSSMTVSIGPVAVVEPPGADRQSDVSAYLEALPAHHSTSEIDRDEPR